MKHFRTTNVVTFFDLSPEWQAEARDNLDDLAEDITYLEPHPSDIPGKHILWDLSEALRITHPDYHSVITVSNNSAIGIKFINNDEQAEMYIL